ncbi:MAG: hypothetical protein K2K82_08685 [Muribaculaceae bacterium]|nr:hypothetical protein [Muribaculaceae bacterium]
MIPEEIKDKARKFAEENCFWGSDCVHESDVLSGFDAMTECLIGFTENLLKDYDLVKKETFNKEDI